MGDYHPIFGLIAALPDDSVAKETTRLVDYLATRDAKIETVDDLARYSLAQLEKAGVSEPTMEERQQQDKIKSSIFWVIR
ncbi:hypothetical protein ACFL0W_06465 [Nanoarchaeota archaeon]